MSVLSYKLTNLLPTSLRIEDLGIILQAAGGRDSVCVVSSDSYERSASLRDHLLKKWVSARPHYEGGNMPAWPVSKPVAAPPAPEPPPSPPAPAIQDVSALHAEMRTMNSKMDVLIAAVRSLASAAPAQPSAGPGPYLPGPVQHHYSGPTGPSSGAPMFIPDRIVPEKAEVHISVHEDQSSGEGFDDSLAALKAARKKK